MEETTEIQLDGLHVPNFSK